MRMRLSVGPVARVSGKPLLSIIVLRGHVAGGKRQAGQPAKCLHCRVTEFYSASRKYAATLWMRHNIIL